MLFLFDLSSSFPDHESKNYLTSELFSHVRAWLFGRAERRLIFVVNKVDRLMKSQLDSIRGASKNFPGPILVPPSPHHSHCLNSNLLGVVWGDAGDWRENAVMIGLLGVKINQARQMFGVSSGGDFYDIEDYGSVVIGVWVVNLGGNRRELVLQTAGPREQQQRYPVFA